MNTVQLSKCISSDPILYRECAGLFAVNKMPKPDGFPFAFITNIDPDTLLGSHWVAIYMDTDGQSEFFDAYGQSPETGPFSSKVHSAPHVVNSVYTISITDCGITV